MVSNAAQLILDEAIAKGSNVHDLYEYAYVQINDTHPSMVIPELIRLLTEKHGISFEEAYTIVQKNDWLHKSHNFSRGFRKMANRIFRRSSSAPC